MPDRELTEEELKRFVTEAKTNKLFNALAIHLDEKGKPSLHDLCIDELNAKIDALTEHAIQQGRAIKLLKKVAGIKEEDP